MADRVPPIIHRVWLDEPMPDPFAGWGDRWRDLHPGWQVVDWVDSEVLPPMRTQHLFDRAGDLVPRDWVRFRSDLARLEILWAVGGVYVDTDVEPLGHLDDLLALDVDRRGCVVGRSPQQDQRTGEHPITNCVIAATAGHPYIAACLDRMADSVRQHRRRHLARISGPWHLTRVWRRHPDLVTVVPADVGMFDGPVLRHHWNTGRRKAGKGLDDGR